MQTLKKSASAPASSIISVTPEEKTAAAPTFGLLPEPRRRWRYLGTGLSYVAQVLILFALAKLPFSLFAPILQPVEVSDNVHLVMPEVVQPQIASQTVVAPKPKVRPIEPKSHAIELPKQTIKAAKVSPPDPPVPVVKTDNPRKLELTPGPKVPRVVVSTNFGGSSAPITENKPAHQLQTGGFGDPNGVPANPNATGKGPVLAKLGSFDLPQGPGSGNGTGGSRGTRGTVPSAGFGDGTAIQGQGGTGGGNNRQGKVQSTTFAAVEPAPAEPPKRTAASTVGKDTAVSLLSKPTPVYTPEARQKKIEGDVELDVEFTATGKVHVLRVLQGLGYGLNEAAVTAAERIQFSPALHDGQPVDSYGRLRIIFRLS
jgi:TonB family protein